MSKQRKMILIAAAVGVISMFLPWISISFGPFGGGSVNGMHDSGILVFLCFVAAGVLAYVGNQTANLNQTAWMITLIAGGIATLIMVINFFDASGTGLLSIGFYLALIAAIAVLAFTFMYKSATDSLQSGFDSLRSNISSKMNTGQTGTTTTNTPTTTVSHTPSDDPARPTV